MTTLLDAGRSESSNPPADVLERIRSIIPEVATRAAEGELQRAVPADVIDSLRSAGVFRMTLPEVWGGEELGLPEASEVVREIARADASTAWVVQVGAMSSLFLRGLPLKTLEDEIFSAGSNSDLLFRGVLAPKGKATRVDGGYKISGRWPLASGSYTPDWVLAGFLVEGASPLPNGRPDIRVAVVRPEEIAFLDTWDAVGLRATQSDDFTMDEVFVPEHRTGPLFGDNNIPAPFYNLPYPPSGGSHDAVVIGVLQGALDDLAELAAVKRPMFNPRIVLGEDPVFQESFGSLRLRTDALTALTRENNRTVMDRVLREETPTPVEWLRYEGGHQLIHRQGVEILNEILTLAGSAAIYSNSTLQRRWRDLRCVAQHVVANGGQVRALGAALSGLQ